MKNITHASLVTVLGIASAADAGVLTYSNRSLAAGVVTGGVPNEVSYTGLDQWFGSRSFGLPTLQQFAGIGSNLTADGFTVSANAALAASGAEFAGYSAYGEVELDFTVTEDSFVTFYLNLSHAAPEGSVLMLELVGASGSVFSYMDPVETTFVRTLAAGSYSIVGGIALAVPASGSALNSSVLSFSGSAVAVPGPATLAAFALLGLVPSRRRR